MELPSDHAHLLSHAERLFPGIPIVVTHALDGEVIYLDVGGRRFTFEIGSDDDVYVFYEGEDSFEIPLMETLPDAWDLP